MSELNPPGVLDGPEVPDASTGAQVQRLAHYALAGGRQGVCGATDLAVSQSSTPGMSVRVAAGVALVNGSTVSYQGTYSCPNTAAVDTLAIAAGDPSNARNDIIVAQVVDANYAGAGKLWQLAVVQGTPAGSPSDPTLPASSLALARVRVDANESTSILNADITDLRVFSGDYGVRHDVAHPYLCQVANAGTFNVADATPTTVSFGGEDTDPYGWHDNSVNPTRITPTVAGWYRCTAGVAWGADTDYVRHLMQINKNGSMAAIPGARDERGVPGTSAPIYDFTSKLIQMNGSSDYFELVILQDNTSGGANTAQCCLLVELVSET